MEFAWLIVSSQWVTEVMVYSFVIVMLHSRENHFLERLFFKGKMSAYSTFQVTGDKHQIYSIHSQMWWVTEQLVEIPQYHTESK